ncbi:conserved hypothetical protein [gamma proteobacterium NOR5-3]|nr:conserved hypothetical protein [gamma proteobacterium NOR5-3]
MKLWAVTAAALTVAVTSISIEVHSAGQSLAGTLEVYVFPSAGQASDRQSKDESECYNWAVTNTGSDPFQARKDAEAAQQQAAQQKAASQNATAGAGARGALRGAAAGALIGEISGGDASKGAAYGATAGVIRGRRQARTYQSQTAQQADQYAASEAAYSEDSITNFKKAFSVCLEAKEYMVKY